MKKSTARFIIISVILMMILNGYLIATIWGKQSENQQTGRKSIEEINAFIVKELGYDTEQEIFFHEAAERHFKTQKQIDSEYREIKYQLNKVMLDNDSSKVHLLAKHLTQLVESKELELYRFLEEVMTFSSEEQRKRLGEVFNEATRPPLYDRKHFEGESKNPPPPIH